MKYCVIETSTGLCVNIIELNSPEQFLSKPNVELAPNNLGAIGWTWINDTWQRPADNYTDEDYARAARIRRNRLLKKQVDAINYMRWSSMSQQEQNDWMAYRQALLDVPQQPGFPRDITWPLRPLNGS
jgi:hypothetical protein